MKVDKDLIRSGIARCRLLDAGFGLAYAARIIPQSGHAIPNIERSGLTQPSLSRLATIPVPPTSTQGLVRQGHTDPALRVRQGHPQPSCTKIGGT